MRKTASGSQRKRTARCWCARTESAATGKPFPGQRTPVALKCHKRMEMLVKGEEETFVCACGYKEKLSAFQNRRAKRGSRSQQAGCAEIYEAAAKEASEPVNNAFAQALAGFKLDE